MVGPETALVPVDRAVRAGLKALTGDLVTFRGQVFRLVEYETGEGEKHAFLAPVDVEVHVSPLTILLGLGAAAIGAVASTIAWNGLAIPAPLGGAIQLVPGIKDSALGKDLARWYERLAIARRIRASGGQVVESRTGLTPEEVEDVLQESIGDAECQLLNREWAIAKRQGRPDDAARFLQQAQEKGCPWVRKI